MDMTKKERNEAYIRYIKDNGYYLYVLVATYNRLEYLKKTIWSLVASQYNSAVKLKIIVLDDKSTDGTAEWLAIMKKNGIISNVITNRYKLGTANAYNTLVASLSAKDIKWFTLTNDDMWYTSEWIAKAIATIYKFSDCGIVNLYDYTALKIDSNSKIIDEDHLLVKVTGLGSVVMNHNLYLKVGGFYLPSTKYMGFFATRFCQKLDGIGMERNKMYHITPSVSYHMDTNGKNSLLREDIPDYVAFRKKNKL